MLFKQQKAGSKLLGKPKFVGFVNKAFYRHYSSRQPLVVIKIHFSRIDMKKNSIDYEIQRIHFEWLWSFRIFICAMLINKWKPEFWQIVNDQGELAADKYDAISSRR